MAGPLHALHVSTVTDPEGREPEELLEAWFTLADIATAVARQGAAVTVVQAAARDAVLERDGVRYRFLGTPAPRRLRRRAGLWATPLSPELGAVCRSLAPDVIHFHSLSFPRHVRCIAQSLLDVPILVQDHADGSPPIWRRGVHRRGLAKVDGVTFTAREQAEPFFRSGVLHRDVPVFVIPESSSWFEPGDRDAARAETGLHGEPCLLWLGHLDRNKDPLTALDALSQTFPELPDPHLWCAYRSSPLMGTVEARVDASPALSGRVHFLGLQPRSRVQLLLRAADFLVQGSRRESCGYAVIEALACGTTPLITDIPSFRQLTGHGAVGALSPPGDSDAMAANLLEWSRRDQEQLRASARRHFEKHLSFPVVGRRLVEVYEELVETRRGLGRPGSTLAQGQRPGEVARPGVGRDGRPRGHSSGVVFRPYRSGDEEGLVELFRTSFGRSATPEWWRWKLLGRTGEADPVIVGEDPEGRPVFQMGGIPRSAVLAGREVNVMVAVDAMTRPDRRGEGVLTAGCRCLFDLWREQGVSVVLGLPNEQWGSRVAALGWRPLFPLRWRVRLLRPEAILARKVGLPPVARIRGPGAIWNRWWDRGRATEESLAVEDRVPLGAELARLHVRIGSEGQHTLVRDADWLRWRYLEPPHRSYRFLSVQKEGLLAGWLAYRICDEEGRKVAYVAEICPASAEGDVERDLLRELIRRLRKAGVECVATLAPPGTRRDRILRGAGFFAAWGAFALHCVVLDRDISHEALADPRRWWIEGGDFDVV